MSTHHGMFVMVSLFVLLRSVLSYYEDNSAENDAEEYEELNKGDVMGDGTLWKSNDDTYTSYPENIKDIFLKNDPQLFLVTSMNRKRNNMARLPANKRMNTMNNSIKDDTQKTPGKSSLSIISPLEALQRKVAVVYNIRQKERNRGLLNNYGKRSLTSSYMDSFPEQNEAVLQSESNKLKQVACCPHYQRRLYSLYRVP